MSRIEDMEQVAGQAEGPSGTRRSLKPQISEALLSRLWRERASRHSLFVTNRGHKIKVLYPGRPNPSSGPDYKDALFYQDGLGLVRGDVELHLSVRDWRAHGHHLDASYNGVTLHVVAGEADKDASLNNGLGAPAISLAPPFKTQQPGPDVAPDALGKILSKAGFPRPSSRQEALQLLERAGVARFLVKSASYQRQMRVQPAQEVIYQALMEAAGYSENRTGFLQLAQKATYALLMRLASAGPPKISLATVEDYLLQAAGFKNASDRSGFRGTPVAPDCWRLFRVRPSNHPRRRVRGMAHLVVHFREAALVGGLKLLLFQENRRSGGPRRRACLDRLQSRPRYGR